MHSQEFEARGRVNHSYKGYGEQGLNAYEGYSDFVVFLRECQWLICATNNRQTNIEFFEAGTIDGGSVLTMAFDVGASLNGAKQGRFSKICALPFPRFTESDEIPLLWFAYASMCTTKSISSGEARFEELNSFGTDGKVGHLSRRAEVRIQFSPEKPNLVQSAAWIAKDGVSTTAVYQCKSSIKVNGFLLPKSWIYELFNIETNKLGVTRRLTHSYQVDLTAYEPVASIQALTPRFSQMGLETMVTDYRFAEEPHQKIPDIRYSVHDKWVTRADLKKSSVFVNTAQVAINEAQFAARTSDKFKNRRSLVLVTLMTTILVALFFLVLRSGIARKTKQKANV